MFLSRNAVRSFSKNISARGLPGVRFFSNVKKNDFQTEVKSLQTVDEMNTSIVSHIRKTNLNEVASKDVKLGVRTMGHSYKTFRIPLSTDERMRSVYLSARGDVRLGKILEELDMLAVHVGYVHNCDKRDLEHIGSLPRTIVTASVHRIDFHRENVHPSRDIFIDGHVSYAGKTSMQVSMRVFQHDNGGQLSIIMKADFVMVSRDPKDGKKSVPVHPLKATTPEEAFMISQAKETIKVNREKQKNSCPSDDELRLINKLYENVLQRDNTCDTPTLKDNEMWLHKTRLSVSDICFPESQNMYGKIFGGFLMRKALELAYTNAKLFVKGQVRIRAIDDISFNESVEIGNILHLDSFVSYTQDKMLQLKVEASVTDQNQFPTMPRKPTLGVEMRKKTNTFHFTMESLEEKEVAGIIPKHYVHAWQYLEGRRHLLETAKRILPSE